MQINSSEIRLASQHAAEKKHSIEVSVDRRFEAVLAQQSEVQGSGPRERQARLLEQLLQAILAALEGRKCRPEHSACRLPEAKQPPATPPAPRPARTLEWSLQGRETISESEQLTVCGSGTIRTADGRCIDFDLDLQLARSEKTERVWGESGKVELRDPLVLNFAGKAAELSGDRLDFDLDSDGTQESIAGLGRGCGYLVLDRNGNGRVDCGKELFGAQSGDGFADLAAYDGDGNGWIDEADAVFKQLAIWRGGSGLDQLSGLAEAGVGALWLGQVDSPFTLKGEDGSLLGQMRATGLWLSEAGAVNTMQQIDLAVSRDAESTPQPGSAAHTGGVAMNGGDQTGNDLIRENEGRPARRHVAVEPGEVGKPAAEHDHRGVEHIDHHTQGARQT